MKVFNNLIIQTIVVDMLSSLAMTTVQLTVESRSGVIFHGSGNPWLTLSGLWRCSPITIVSIANNVTFWSVPIQAFYRYIVIVRKLKVPPWCPVVVYGTVGLFIAIVTSPAAFMSEIDSPLLSKMQEMGLWRGTDTHALCVIDIVTWPVFVYLFVLMGLQQTAVSILMWCNKQLNKTLDDSSMHFSAKTKEIHKEMTQKLYAQTAVPMGTGMLLVAICVCLFIMPSYSGGIFEALVLPYAFTVVVNPLVTLFCIKQYRNVAILILRGRKSKIEEQISVFPDNSKVTLNTKINISVINIL
uniref:G_PROTEIN_RECEP_F1_2 domain-containing protein n=1 Tax=Panagrellus redivivus TaxID=6233 RepID=A0A7E4VHH6_PANRE